MQAQGSIYLATFGGAGAYLSQCIKSSELVALDTARSEAMFRLEIEDFPVVVVNDVLGQDYYEAVKNKLFVP